MATRNVDLVVRARLLTPSESCTERCVIPNRNNIDNKNNESWVRYVPIRRKNRLREQSRDVVFDEKLGKDDDLCNHSPCNIDFNRRRHGFEVYHIVGGSGGRRNVRTYAPAEMETCKCVRCLTGM